jgi:queuine tRNA-ribosyltransferase
MCWHGPAASDSGGFQVFSLMMQSKKLGSVTRRGFNYRFDKEREKKLLSPEKCIQKQFQLNTDIMFCLDYCTHPEWDNRLQEESVMYTIEWAKRCKEEFMRNLDMRDEKRHKPLLFAVIQGGNDHDLRLRCAENLLAIGFDGFGFGGWPVDDEGRLSDMVEYVSELVPGEFPKHALGIGKPGNIVRSFKLGYHLFDCSIPTRDARRKRLFVFKDNPSKTSLDAEEFYRYLYIQDKKYVRDTDPVDLFCDCICCANYSRSYLHHLFEIEDHLAYRLATIHNLRFYTRLMERLK